MTNEDKTKFVKDYAGAAIDKLKAQWAQNYCALVINENIIKTETDEKKLATARKETDACNKFMSIAEQEIINYEWVLKNLKF